MSKSTYLRNGVPIALAKPKCAHAYGKFRSASEDRYRPKCAAKESPNYLTFCFEDYRQAERACPHYRS